MKFSLVKINVASWLDLFLIHTAETEHFRTDEPPQYYLVMNVKWKYFYDTEENSNRLIASGLTFGKNRFKL